MTISVLDRTGGSCRAELSSAASTTPPAGCDEELLPCRVNDPELWFAESPADVEFAKTLCLDCPVQALCLDGALERREPWGVWGGELFLQGVVIPRKRPRGRPRKNEQDDPRDPTAAYGLVPNESNTREDQPERK